MSSLLSCHIARVGDDRAFVVQAGKRHAHEFARFDQEAAGAVFFDVHTTAVEYRIHVLRQQRIVILRLRLLGQPVGDNRTERVVFEQSVAATVECFVQFPVRRLRIAGQLAQCFGLGLALMQRGDELFFDFDKHRLSGRTGFLECIQALVVPVEHHCQRAVFEIRHVDLDGIGLADAIEAADALFEQIGIKRQIE